MRLTSLPPSPSLPLPPSLPSPPPLPRPLPRSIRSRRVHPLFHSRVASFPIQFLEFEFRPDGKMRYANNSNYKGDAMIRKEVFVNEAVIESIKKIVKVQKPKCP